MNVKWPRAFWTKRGSRNWLRRNNPFEPGTIAFHQFARDFHLDQAAKHGKVSVVFLVLATIFLLVSFAAQLVRVLS